MAWPWEKFLEEINIKLNKINNNVVASKDILTSNTDKLQDLSKILSNINVLKPIINNNNEEIKKLQSAILRIEYLVENKQKHYENKELSYSSPPQRKDILPITSKSSKECCSNLSKLDDYEHKIKEMANKKETLNITIFLDFCERLLNFAKEINLYNGDKKNFFHKERISNIAQCVFQNINEKILSLKALTNQEVQELFLRTLSVQYAIRQNLQDDFKFNPIDIIETNQRFDPSDRKYTSVGIIKIGNESWNLKIAELVAYGYELNGEVLLPAQVKVYRYDPGLKDVQITSVSPDFAFKGQTLKIIIRGNNFSNEITSIKLENTVMEINAKSFNIINSSEISSDFDLIDSIYGRYDIVIMDKDGKNARISNCFDIFLPLPRLDSIKPNKIILGEETEIIFEGENFTKDTKIFLKKNNIKEEIEHVTYESSNILKVKQLFKKEYNEDQYDILVVNEIEPEYAFIRCMEEIVENKKETRSFLFKNGIRIVPIIKLNLTSPKTINKEDNIEITLTYSPSYVEVKDVWLQQNEFFLKSCNCSVISEEVHAGFNTRKIPKGKYDIILETNNGDKSEPLSVLTVQKEEKSDGKEPSGTEDIPVTNLSQEQGNTERQINLSPTIEEKRNDLQTDVPKTIEIQGLSNDKINIPTQVDDKPSVIWIIPKSFKLDRSTHVFKILGKNLSKVDCVILKNQEKKIYLQEFTKNTQSQEELCFKTTKSIQSQEELRVKFTINDDLEGDWEVLLSYNNKEYNTQYKLNISK